jgi:hypothetical protein
MASTVEARSSEARSDLEKKNILARTSLYFDENSRLVCNTAGDVASRLTNTTRDRIRAVVPAVQRLFAVSFTHTIACLVKTLLLCLPLLVLIRIRGEFSASRVSMLPQDTQSCLDPPRDILGKLCEFGAKTLDLSLTARFEFGQRCPPPPFSLVAVSQDTLHPQMSVKVSRWL